MTPNDEIRAALVIAAFALLIEALSFVFIVVL